MNNPSESKSKWRYVGIVGLVACIIFSMLNIRNIVALRDVFVQVGFERYIWFIYLLTVLAVCTLAYAFYALIARKQKK